MSRSAGPHTVYPKILRVVQYKFLDVSAEHIASIFRTEEYAEEEISKQQTACVSGIFLEPID
jgi:hypothetical protein